MLLPLLLTTIIADNSHGTIHFQANDKMNNVPIAYRMKSCDVPYNMELKYDLKQSDVKVYDVSFPSAVKSPHDCNNIVYAELFMPTSSGPHPAMLVLDILDGKGLVSRGEAMWLATHDIAALAMVMPYYGPRRPTEGKFRLLSTDVELSKANVRQTVLDARLAIAFLAGVEGVDPERLGILGTSLGSFMGSLTAAAEPRLSIVCLLLGGGGLVDAFYAHPKATAVVTLLRFFGNSKDDMKRWLAVVDPLTFADRLKEKRLLLVAASRDDVVPPSAMTRLWEATDKPPIVWVDTTHVGSALYVFPIMQAVIDHVQQKH